LSNRRNENEAGWTNKNKEGLVYSYKVLDLKTIEQNGKVTEQGEERKEKNFAAGLQPTQVASVKAVSLANKMRDLRVSEQDESTRRAHSDAKDRFKQARQQATEAFCNEALSTSDRILAMQYRVMPTLLEKINNSAEAFATCHCALKSFIPCQRSKKASRKPRLKVLVQQG